MLHKFQQITDVTATLSQHVADVNINILFYLHTKMWLTMDGGYWWILQTVYSVGMVLWMHAVLQVN